MKKKIFIVFTLLLVFTSCFSQSTSYQISLLCFNKSIKLYDSSNRNKVIKVINEDEEKEIYYSFNVIKKNKNMIKVDVTNTLNNKITRGWINIFDTGTYTRTYSDYKYPLYKKPTTNSQLIIHIFDKYGTLVRVLDIYKDWLKIEVKHKNITYKYWIPMKYTCPTVYNSCT